MKPITCRHSVCAVATRRDADTSLVGDSGGESALSVAPSVRPAPYWVIRHSLPTPVGEVESPISVAKILYET